MIEDTRQAIPPNRPPSSTSLPDASNNFSQGSFTFYFTPVYGQPESLTLALNPEEFTQTEASTSNVVLTAGDVFSDSFGGGLTKISISGTFGHKPSGGTGSGSGQLEVLKLRDLFRKYLDEINPIITKSPERNVGAKLEFYNDKDSEFWRIEPVGDYFTLKRSKTSPFLYRYSLSFICLGPVTPGVEQDTQRLRDQVITQMASNNNVAKNVLKDAAKGLKDIDAKLDQIGRQENLFTTAVLNPLGELSVAVDGFVSASTQVINYPIASVVFLKNTCHDMLESISKGYTDFLSGVFSGFDSSPDLCHYLTKTMLYCDKCLLYTNSFTYNYIKSDFINQTTVYDTSITYVDLSTVKNVYYITIKDGDTLESLALLSLGSSDFWKVLAEFNNLVYPFISNASPLPEKTLAPGMKIAVPLTDGGNSGNNLILGQNVPNDSPGGFGNNTNNINPVFGTDLLLGPDGDISFTTKSNPDGTTTGDVVTITGLDEFKQEILLKIHIIRGELVKHPHFGVPKLPGGRTLSFLASKVKADIQSTILTDSRVQKANVKVNLVGDTLSYSAELSVNFQSLPIILTGDIR